MSDALTDCIATKVTREKDFAFKALYHLRQYLKGATDRKEYLYQIDLLAFEAKDNLTPVDLAWIARENAWRTAELEIA